jgi:hypothetical protein
LLPISPVTTLAPVLSKAPVPVKSAKVEVTPRFGAWLKLTIDNRSSKSADNVLSNLVFIKVYY